MDAINEGIDIIKKAVSESTDNSSARIKVRETIKTIRKTTIAITLVLPEIPKQGFTKLDLLVRDRRRDELAILECDLDGLLGQLDNIPLSEVIANLEEMMLSIKAVAIEVRSKM